MAEEIVELQVFYCKEAYVYQVPPATTVGHRADLWNVNKWLSEVAVRVVTHEEECYVRLEDCKTGELFAECPLPPDAPLVTVVEPVIDSSRYFVLRIVDRDTDRHAFIGLGFRERSEASNFNATLYEHLQYLKRKRVAEARRREFEEREQRASEGSEGADTEALSAIDYSIKPGEKITIKLNVAKQDKAENFLSKGSKLGARLNLFASGGEAGGLALPPPPAPRRASQLGNAGSGELSSPVSPGASAAAMAMCVSPRGELHTTATAAASPVVSLGAAVGSLELKESPIRGSGADDATPAPLQEPSIGVEVGAATDEVRQVQLSSIGTQEEGGSSAAAEGAAVEDDDWGDFTSS